MFATKLNLVKFTHKISHSLKSQDVMKTTK